MKRTVLAEDRRGVTILEVLIVGVVAVLLIALMLPPTVRTRETSRRTECANNLKQIGLALHTYVDSQEVVPPAIIHSPDSSYTPRDFVLGTTGWLLLLPYLDKQGLYDQYDFSQGAVPGSIGPSESNQRITATRMRVFYCPADQVPASITKRSAPGACYNAAASNYLFGGGSRFNPLSESAACNFPLNEAAPSYEVLRESKGSSRGLFGHNGAARFAEVRDGLGYTLMAGETLQDHATGAVAAVVWGQGKLYG